MITKRTLISLIFLATSTTIFSSSEPAFVPDHTKSKTTATQNQKKTPTTEYSFHIAYFEKQTDQTEKKCAETIVGAKTLDEALTKINHYLATTIPLEKGCKTVKITPTVISGGKAQRMEEVTVNNRSLRFQDKNRFIQRITNKIRRSFEIEMPIFWKVLRNFFIATVTLGLICMYYLAVIFYPIITIVLAITMGVLLFHPVGWVILAVWVGMYYLISTLIYYLFKNQPDNFLYLHRGKVSALILTTWLVFRPLLVVGLILIGCAYGIDHFYETNIQEQIFN